MKNSKLFLFGLLVSLSAYAHVQAAAAAEEVKEQAEVKEAAAAFDPSSKERTLEFLIKGFEAKRSEPLQWPAVLTKKIEESTPTFQEESITLGEKYGTVTNFFISPDERYMALAVSGNVVVYDMQSLREILNIPLGDSRVDHVCFFPQNNQYGMALFMQSGHETLDKVRLYDLNSPKKAPRVLSGKIALRGLSSFDNDKKYVVFKQFNKKNYALYQLFDLQRKFVFPDFDAEHTGIVFSPNGNYVALQNAVEHSIMIYDLEDLDKAPKKLEGDAITFAPDGNSLMVSFRDKDQMLFYTLPDLVREPRSLKGRTIEFSPQGQYVAVNANLSNGDSQLRLYKRDDFEAPLQEFTSRFNTLSFFPDERYIAVKKSEDANQIKIYDMHNFDTPPKIIVGDFISVSHDGRYIVLYRYNGHIDLYESNNLDKPLTILRGTFVDKFSARDRYLVRRGAHGGVVVYNLLALKKRAEKERAQLLPVPEESTSDWLKRFSEFSIEQLVPKE